DRQCSAAPRSGLRGPDERPRPRPGADAPRLGGVRRGVPGHLRRADWRGRRDRPILGACRPGNQAAAGRRHRRPGRRINRRQYPGRDPGAGHPDRLKRGLTTPHTGATASLSRDQAGRREIKTTAYKITCTRETDSNFGDDREVYYEPEKLPRQNLDNLLAAGW